MAHETNPTFCVTDTRGKRRCRCATSRPGSPTAEEDLLIPQLTAHECPPPVQPKRFVNGKGNAEDGPNDLTMQCVGRKSHKWMLLALVVESLQYQQRVLQKSMERQVCVRLQSPFSKELFIGVVGDIYGLMGPRNAKDHYIHVKREIAALNLFQLAPQPETVRVSVASVANSSVPSVSSADLLLAD